MLKHIKEIEFSGNFNQVVEDVVNGMRKLGFREMRRDGKSNASEDQPAERTSVELRGPGLKRTNQALLLGASKIVLSQSGNKLRLAAELGGVEEFTKQQMVFPRILCLSLAFILALGIAEFFDVNRGFISLCVAGIMAFLMTHVTFVLAIPKYQNGLAQNTIRTLNSLLRDLAQVK